MEQKRCISSLTLEQLSAELKALGQPGFRAKQIFHWVHQKLVTEFSAMTTSPRPCWPNWKKPSTSLPRRSSAVRKQRTAP